MTRNAAECGPPNAGSRAGACSEVELDRLARLEAQLLEAQLLEADRHQYPIPPQRLHKGSVPTGGVGGGLLHQRAPVQPRPND